MRELPKTGLGEPVAAELSRQRKMRRLVVLLSLLALPLGSMAGPLVGFATISMKGMSPSQPNSCARLPTETEGENCVEFHYTRIYKVRDFVDVEGHKVRVGTMVMTGHLRQEGPWFLVLEELSARDQEAYGARYKFVDGSTILPMACTRRDVNEYITLDNNDKFNSYIVDNGSHCYLERQLRKRLNVR